MPLVFDVVPFVAVVVPVDGLVVDVVPFVGVVVPVDGEVDDPDPPPGDDEFDGGVPDDPDPLPPSATFVQGDGTNEMFTGPIGPNARPPPFWLEPELEPEFEPVLDVLLAGVAEGCVVCPAPGCPVPDTVMVALHVKPELEDGDAVLVVTGVVPEPDVSVVPDVDCPDVPELSAVVD